MLWVVFMAEVLPPSPNITAVIKDGNLLVTWALPQGESEEECFGHQLDLGDHVRHDTFIRLIL